MTKHLLSNKRLLALLFALFFGMQMGCAYDFSAVCPTGQTLYYNITDATNKYVGVICPSNISYYYWSGYTQPTGEMVIPLTVRYGSVTYTIKSIEDYAFYGCSGLTSVSIGNSVTTIGNDAFYGCSGLTSVEIPNSVTTIGNSAFNGCNLTSVYYTGSVAQWCRITFANYASNPVYGAHLYINNALVADLSIPNSVTSIGNYAFYGCSGLTSVEIPNSVTSIGDYAFGGCSGLTSVSIGNSVTSIGNYAFSGCSNLTSMSIGNSVTTIGKSAFNGCSGLTSVEIPNSVTSIGDYAFQNCSGLSSVEIPNSVTTIGNYAFQNCSGLSSVEIPNSVTTIGNSAFYGCNALTSVILNSNAIASVDYNGSIYNLTIIFGTQFTSFTFGPSVTKIGNHALHGCSNLISVSIGNSVTTIGNSAFDGCSGLTSVSIGNSVTTIGNSAFQDCSGLTSVEIPNSVTTIGNSAFQNCSGLTSVGIPNSVTSIGNSAFDGCSTLTSVILNSNAIASANYTSSNNLKNIFGSQITNFTFGPSVTKIGNHALHGCSNLTSVSIGNSVTTIGNSAFDGCSGLTSVSIGNSVTTIGNYAFSGCSGLTSVSIGNSVTTIGDYAFYQCSGLTSVEIPNSVTSIGGSAFYGCSGLTSVEIPNSVTSISNGVFYGCSGLTSVEIPVSVTSIGNGAFSGCSGLTSVEIPNSVTTIGNYAFSGCSGLTSVSIGNSVTTIGNYAFSGCSGLTSVEIPNSVTTIGDSAFDGCSGLTSVSIGNSVTSIGNSAFNGCSNLTSVILNSNAIASANYTSSNNLKNIFGSQITNFTFGPSVTTIGNSAFSGCSGLTSVSIGNSVTTIGNYAFNGCSGLTSVSIGKSVTTIGNSAFYGCNGLTSVILNSNAIASANYTNSNNLMNIFGAQITNFTFGPSVTTIGNYALYGCSNLTSVSIGNSVTTIGNYAFDGCSGLTSVSIGNSVTTIGNFAFYQCSGLTSVEIPNSVTSIGGSAFYGCSGLTSVSIGNSVTSIGGSAFYGCSGLTSVSIGNSVTSIGDYAFYGCSNLTSVSIGNSVTSIRNYAFYGCSNLTSVSIGNSVTSIGNYAFSGCSGLTSVEIPNSVTSIGDYAFYNCSGLTSVSIGNSVTSIRNYAFYGCSNLTSVEIPNSVTTIGNSAFQDCSGLTSVEIPNSVTTIGNSAFNGCSNLTSVILNSNAIASANYTNSNNLMNIFGAQITNFTFGPSVTTIGNYALYGCSNLTSVSIGNSVTTIGNSAFDGCSGLTSVYYTGSVAQWCRITFANYASNPVYGAHLYINNALVADLSIPNSVTSIGNYAFYGCSGLTSVEIPNSVTSIGDYAFYGCSNLTSVSIGNSVTTIGDYAFYQCSGLTSVEIPNSVTTIGDYAFYQCSGLTSVEIPNSVTTIGNSAFYGCNALTLVILNSNAIASANYLSYNNLKNIFGAQVTSYTFGPSVTKIGNYALYGCSNLTSVSVGNSVTSIGNSAFSGCNALTLVILNSNAIASANYTSSNNLKNIFGAQVTSYTFGPSVTSIGNYVLYGCSGLTSLILGNSVTSIGSRALYGCSGLTSIVSYATTPPTVGSYTFYNVPTTAVVHVLYCAESYQTANGWSRFTTFEEFDDDYFCAIIDFDDDNVKAICVAQWDTNGDGELSKAEADAVTNLGTDFAFSDITSFEELQYFTSLTTIEDDVFFYCGSLNAIALPRSLTSIGNAFSGCSSLMSITSFATVPPAVGANAFQDVPASATVHVPCSYTAIYQSTPGWNSFANYEEFDAGDICPIVFTDANVKALCVGNWDTDGNGELSYVEAAAVTSLGEVFSNNATITSFDELQYFTGLTAVGTNAFQGCSGLTSVEIPNSVTSIGSSAFSGCSALTSVVIPNSVTSIGDQAFYGCSGLTSIEIPGSVTSIGTDAFEGCTGLTSVHYTGSVKQWCGITFASAVSNPVHYAHNLYLNNALVTDLSIPTSVSSIRNYAFTGCTSITSLTLPSNVTSIGTDAFEGCTGLASVHYTGSVEQWFGITFASAVSNPVHYAHNLYIDNALVTDLSIPTSVSSIPNYVFTGCTSITSLTLPSNVTSIGNSAFEGCSNMASINANRATPPTLGTNAFEGVNTLIPINLPCGAWAAYQAASGWNAFSNYIDECSPIVFADDNVKTICVANWDTNGDGELSYVEAAAVNAIGDVFKSNTDITSFDEFEYFTSVTAIPNMAFLGCTNLGSITLPANIESIGNGSFFNCTGLTSLTVLAATPPTLGTQPFRNVDATIPVYVPCESYEAYQGWAGFSNFVCVEDGILLVNGYGDTDGGYYLIATPYASVNPANVAGMMDGSYDLYYFDQAEDLEWRNYKDQPFNLEAGKGYLYAHQTDAMLSFTGTPYSGNGVFPLGYEAGKQFAGWNLMGNPYAQNITSYTTVNVANGCYVMNGMGDNLVVSEISGTNPLKPYEGLFVKATATDASINFNPSRGTMANHSGSVRVEVVEGGKLIDRLIVKTVGGEPLEKLSLNGERAKLYATSGGQELAIVPRDGDEQAVNFKVEKNGAYTLYVIIENTDLDYLHLIDNLTGVDVDLLATPSYTFTSKPTDYASRFKLVFRANENDNENEEFAFISNGEIVVNGTGTLQVIDVTGRVVSSHSVSNHASIDGLTAGVYVLRLINNDHVKIQKIVIK